MSKFKVGDKVIGNDPHRYAITNEGWRGEVVGLGGSMIIVSDGDSKYWVSSEFFDLVRPVARPVTVITTDGTTTTATLREGKRVIRTATAKCSPKDRYNYATGARLALGRLFPEANEAASEPPKPKCYTGKVVCVKSGYPWWTVGKVYDIVDGTITADDGDKYRGYISAEDARHAGRTIDGAPFPGSDAGHNPDNEFIPFVEG